MKGDSVKEKSRTAYSTINTSVAILCRVVAILMGFVTRVVFTRMLNENYVGVNGLFTDVLNILSLAELGVGTTITYALYRPIAEKDIEKQQALMNIFKWFYRITAAIVAIIGLALIPFMDIWMKNPPEVEHLILIYLLYLAKSVLSYLMVYKRTLIEAYQMNYIVLLYETTFYVLQDIAQIVILITTKNFILFLLIYIASVVLNNIFLSRKADRMFPFLKEKSTAKLPEEEKKDIFKNIRAMLMHKIGDVLVNSTDNLIISSFVGVISVGLYSNYYLLIGSVKQVVDQIFQGITASVGNLGAKENNERVRTVYETAFFIGQWLYGFAAICLYELLSPFVEMSFGAKYVFPREVVLILCINFFMTGTRKATLVFRDSLGLFWFDRYKSIVEALINLVVSIALVQKFGVFGVFAGTLCSMLLTSIWVEPYVLYKQRLQVSSKGFFVKYAGYCVAVAAAWILSDAVCRVFNGGVIYEMIVHLMVCIIVPNSLFLLLYVRTKEFAVIRGKVASIWNARKGADHGIK